MKVLKVLVTMLLIALLASCTNSRAGFDYSHHAKKNKHYGKVASKRADRASTDLTLFDCSK